jgi:endoglucanase
VTIVAGDKIKFSITPAAPTGAMVQIELIQTGEFTDSNFTQSFDADISAACTASSGKYTWGGEYVTISPNVSDPLVIEREVASVPSGYSTYAITAISVAGAFSYKPTSVVSTGTPSFTVPALTKGVNVSGMEFSGSIYTAPFFPSNADIDFYYDSGFTCIRLPFKWSRLQNAIYGPLNIVGDGSGDAEKVKALVEHITITMGMYCILDCHDYGTRAGYSVKIGDPILPTTAFEDFWVKLIQYIGISNQKVIIDLMNEPASSIGASNWTDICSSVTAAIRATGSTQHIHVEGMQASGAWTWISSGTGAAMLNYYDPIDNYSFQAHQYLNADGSGNVGTCVVNSGNRLTNFLTWLADNNKKGFIGEFAGGIAYDPQCTPELEQLLTDANADGNINGWTAWGGGSNWLPNYIFRIENPDEGGPDTAYMEILKDYQ